MRVQKSILITGPQGSGKTTLMREILSLTNTKFYKDEVTSYEKIEEVYSKARLRRSFCVIATQMDLKDLPKQILSKFTIVNLK